MSDSAVTFWRSFQKRDCSFDPSIVHLKRAIEQKLAKKSK